MGKPKKKKLRQKSKKEKRIDFLGISVGGIFLVILWITCISYFVTGNYFGHKNYIGLSVGTYLLLSMLLVATPVFIVMSWRTIKGTDNKEVSETPIWMKQPPFRWPWE